MNDRVLVSVEGGVADVRLNRPDKLNSLDPEMFVAITEAARQLAVDRSLRAVVLRGEGRAFCSGLDFASFQRMQQAPSTGESTADLTAATTSPANRAQLPVHIWSELPVPVIAAVHGYAFGGGLQIALGADIRIVAPDAQFSIMEVKWGLIPDMAGTQKLRHLTRLDVAKELTFTGRVIGGAEAVALGLATRVAEDPVAAAMALAHEIAGKSPHAVRAAKLLFEQSRQVTVAEGLKMEETLQLGLIGSPNQVEAVRSNFEKRSPRFVDP